MATVSMDLETATVDMAAEASVRGIDVGQEWHITFSLDDLRAGVEMLVDQAEEEGQSEYDATVEVLPHPKSGDGVILKLRRD